MEKLQGCCLCKRTKDLCKTRRRKFVDVLISIENKCITLMNVHYKQKKNQIKLLIKHHFFLQISKIKQNKWIILKLNIKTKLLFLFSQNQNTNSNLSFSFYFFLKYLYILSVNTYRYIHISYITTNNSRVPLIINFRPKYIVHCT